MQILIFFRCNLKTHQISHAMFAVMFALIVAFWGDRMKAYWRKAIYMCPEVALNWTTSLVHMNFQMIFSFEQSRTIFTVVCLFTKTLFHVTRPAIVQDLLSTVLTSNCHVSSYVHLRFGPSCACHFTLFTRQHTIIMLFSASSDFHQKELQSYIWHRTTFWSQFRSTDDAFCSLNILIFPYQNENGESLIWSPDDSTKKRR